MKSQKLTKFLRTSKQVSNLLRTLKLGSMFLEKYLLLFAFLVFFEVTPCSSQYFNHVCGNSNGSQSSQNVVNGPLQFIPLDNCKPLSVKCNFVFLTNANGGGTFNPNIPSHSNILQIQENGINWRLGNIENSANCSYDIPYNRDTYLRCEFERHYVSNQLAYDYSVQGGVSCPGSITFQPLLNVINSVSVRANALAPRFGRK